MEIRLAVPDGVIDERTIDAALEATTRANEALARRGLLPDIREAISTGKVRWRPEPWIGERFDLAPTVLSRGWGDCDDLGPWLAAQMRVMGAAARARVRRSGPSTWHVEVEEPDGSIHDPSRWAGMGKGKEHRPFSKAQKPIVGADMSGICVLPYQGKWWARADYPLDGSGIHAIGWSVDESAEDALADAIASYSLLVEGISGVGEMSVASGLRDIAQAVGPLSLTALGKSALPDDKCLPMTRGLRHLGCLVCKHDVPAPAAPEVAGEGKEAPPAPPPAPRLLTSTRLPHGWPAATQCYELQGPGGVGLARAMALSGGGPVLLGF